MSTQRGNSSRTRPQKHKNRTAFKNNLHDTSDRTKLINNIQISDVCLRCKQIIEWKIKYKKYKPLTQPKKCVKCEQRTVKQAYHVMCFDCGRKLDLCTKCCQKKELIVPPQPDEKQQLQLDNEMKQLLESLSERKRRTFIRYMNKKSKEKNSENQDDKNDLKAKLDSLKIKDDNDDDDSDIDSDFDNFDSDS